MIADKQTATLLDCMHFLINIFLLEWRGIETAFKEQEKKICWDKRIQNLDDRQKSTISRWSNLRKNSKAKHKFSGLWTVREELCAH